MHTVELITANFHQSCQLLMFYKWLCLVEWLNALPAACKSYVYAEAEANYSYMNWPRRFARGTDWWLYIQQSVCCAARHTRVAVCSNTDHVSHASVVTVHTAQWIPINPALMNRNSELSWLATPLWSESTNTWRRHQLVTLSALLATCAGNSAVTGGFPSQRPVTRSFAVFFDLRLNKRLSKQPWSYCFETPSHPLWRHLNKKKRTRKIAFTTAY